jgi:hypothetical protein
MFIATTIVSGLLALVLVASAGAKLAKMPQVMDVMTTVEFPQDKLWLAPLRDNGAWVAGRWMQGRSCHGRAWPDLPKSRVAINASMLHCLQRGGCGGFGVAAH